MSYSYAHMCRDEHTQIGHNDSGDDERCPLCQAIAISDSYAEENQRFHDEIERLRAALKHIAEADAAGESAVGIAAATLGQAVGDGK